MTASKKTVKVKIIIVLAIIIILVFVVINFTSADDAPTTSTTPTTSATPTSSFNGTSAVGRRCIIDTDCRPSKLECIAKVCQDGQPMEIIAGRTSDEKDKNNILDYTLDTSREKCFSDCRYNPRCKSAVYLNSPPHSCAKFSTSATIDEIHKGRVVADVEIAVKY